MVVLDGNGYWIEPETYKLSRPRVRTATLNRTIGGFLGAGERLVDQGPAKREWDFVVVAWQAIRGYDGQVVGTDGQTYRDQLHTSYEKVNTRLSFTDPHGQAWNVHFDDISEEIADVRAQGDGKLQYFVSVKLVEA